MALRYKEWGGIRKAETEVVRIKGRRRDKGGGGWEKQISRVGGSAPYIYFRLSSFAKNCQLSMTITMDM
jgi:hypothetical protein